MTNFQSSDSVYATHFNREAHLLAQLEHPHIVRIYDYGIQTDFMYLVMAYMGGGSLQQRLKQINESNSVPLSLREIATILIQIAGALDYAHQKGVLHRDVKPANIMFDSEGRAHLADFGIAKMMGTKNEDYTVGTANYMPREQWEGTELKPASDQYALGITIFQCIAGRLPFVGDSIPEVMLKHVREEPPPLSITRADIPTALTLVVHRAMAKQPDDRFRNCTQFAQAFTDALDDAQQGSMSFSGIVPTRTPAENQPEAPIHITNIFISYAKKDTRPLAKALFDALNALDNIKPWMDGALEADSSWAHQIQTEIDRADYFIVLLSPDVNREVRPRQARSFVLNEIDYAQAEYKPILPVLVHKTRIPVQIAGIQYIDLQSTPTDPTPIVAHIVRKFKLIHT